MTRQHRNKTPARLLRSLYVWHRHLGLAASAFVMLLAATGLLLNHTDDLRLDSRYISSNGLLDWYGIHAPRDITLFHTKTLALAGMGGSLYVNLHRLPATSGTPVGAVDFGGMVVVALADHLLLLTPAGELIENMDEASGLPVGISAVGVSTDQLDVRTTKGDYQTNRDLLKWTRAVLHDVQWSRPVAPTTSECDALERVWRGTGLSVERVLLDVHSGRILGRGGPYLVDAAAILFLLLATSGIWLWGRRRASARAHQRRIEQRSADAGNHSPTG